MNRTRRAFLAITAVIAVALASGVDAQQETALRVTGDVASALELTVDDLKKFPARQVDDARGAEKGADASGRRYTGVRLRDILDKAKLVERQPRGPRRSIVVVTARDGYKAVFSWAELYLSPIGHGVFVVYERNGAPLSAGEGRLALISLKDNSPGPRHVKWLQANDVRMVSD